MKSKNEVLLVSACLAGENCKYSGGNNLVPSIRELVAAGHAVCVCPEVLGGLPTPRLPSEIQRDGRVLNRAGQDVTEAFCLGAEKALDIARAHGCQRAILKARSPSCGRGLVYSGGFDGTLVSGNGIAAELLMKNGIEVMTEQEWLEKSVTPDGADPGPRR